VTLDEGGRPYPIVFAIVHGRVVVSSVRVLESRVLFLRFISFFVYSLSSSIGPLGIRFIGIHQGLLSLAIIDAQSDCLLGGLVCMHVFLEDSQSVME
jgi:hypothetical protein